MQSSEAVTVSRPAMRNRKQMSRMSSSVSAVPVDLGVEEHRQDVVLALGLALVEGLLKYVVDPRRRSGARAG